MRMTQNARLTLNGELIPHDASTALVEREHTELLLGGVVAAIRFPFQLALEYHLRIRADRRYDEHEVIPNNRAREPQSGNGRLPCNVRAGFDVPGDRQVRALR